MAEAKKVLESVLFNWPLRFCQQSDFVVWLSPCELLFYEFFLGQPVNISFFPLSGLSI